MRSLYIITFLETNLKSNYELSLYDNCADWTDYTASAISLYIDIQADTGFHSRITQTQASFQIYGNLPAISAAALGHRTVHTLYSSRESLILSAQRQSQTHLRKPKNNSFPKP